MARRALMRMWHGGVFVPAVFGTLVTGVKVDVLLAPDRLLPAMFFPVLWVLLAIALLLVVLVLGPPVLAPVKLPSALKTAYVLRLPIIPVQVKGGSGFAPAAPEVLEMIGVHRVAVLPSVALGLPVVWVSFIVLFVLHLISFSWWSKRINSGHSSIHVRRDNQDVPF